MGLRIPKNQACSLGGWGLDDFQGEGPPGGSWQFAAMLSGEACPGGGGGDVSLNIIRTEMVSKAMGTNTMVRGDMASQQMLPRGHPHFPRADRSRVSAGVRTHAVSLSIGSLGSESHVGTSGIAILDNLHTFLQPQAICP